MEVFELGAWPLHIPVMKEKLQASQHLLWTALNQPDNMRRTEKTMPMNQSDDFKVAVGESEGWDFNRPCEAGKSGGLHSAILTRRTFAKKGG